MIRITEPKFKEGDCIKQGVRRGVVLNSSFDIDNSMWKYNVNWYYIDDIELESPVTWGGIWETELENDTEAE